MSRFFFNPARCQPAELPTEQPEQLFVAQSFEVSALRPRDASLVSRRF